MKHTTVTAIIACAGKGKRAGFSQNKLFETVNNTPVILKTALIFDGVKRIDKIIIVYAKNELTTVKKLLKPLTKPVSFVEGGKTRFQSIKNALNTVENGVVVIHDGARPFVSQKTVNACIKSALLYGSGVVGAPCVNTILETDGKANVISSSRKNKMMALTPQAFEVEKLKLAYSFVEDESLYTDDAGVYCAHVGKCKLVEGEQSNVKLTYKQDFNDFNETLVGTGYDLHRLVYDRKLILGGVEIPNEKGLLGHSDADVLTHAIMDAILSSLSLGDIGYHFSDKDPQYKDICSMELLKRVLKMADEKGYKVNNVSAVIMAEKPKLMNYILPIKLSLSLALNLPLDKIGISATTLEGVGLVGNEEAIASSAYVSVVKR